MMDDESVEKREKRKASKERTAQRKAAAAAAAVEKQMAEEQKAEQRKRRAEEPMFLRRPLGSQRIADKAACASAWAMDDAAAVAAADPMHNLKKLTSYFAPKPREP